MPGNQRNSIFEYIADYSGFIIKLRSDHTTLLELSFIEKKCKLKENNKLMDPLKKALTFLDDYFRGVKSSIEIIFYTGLSRDKCPGDSRKLFLNMNGYTEKEISVYKELMKVEPGRTVSYSEIASRSGIPRGARFAGNCMAANRFPVIIPCHRVIKKDGSIGNYTGGAEIKKFLLKHEKENSPVM